MSQNDVFNFLKIKKITEPERYFTKTEIMKALGPNACTKNVPRAVNGLFSCGMLEIKTNGSGWKNSGYRLKSKCLPLDEPKHPLSPSITIDEYRRLT